MAVELSIDPTLPRQSFLQTLDGVSYRVSLAYNVRTLSYWLSLALADGTALLSGVHVRHGVPLLRNITRADLPPGNLLCISDTGETPTEGELGDAARLVYLPAS